MPSPFYAEVISVQQLSPHFVRITLGGAAMELFTPVGRDQWLRLFLPRPGEDKPALPSFNDDTGLRSWYNSTPAQQRPTIRNYTVRRFDAQRHELEVDFVVHGDTGPASAWAQLARPGNIVGIYDQGAMFTPDARADWQLLVADETGLPAIAAISEATTVTTEAFIEVPLVADQQELTFPPGSQQHWYFREPHHDHGNTLLIDAVTNATFPSGNLQALLLGESGMVTALRRLLVEHGVPKDMITFCGYWRHGNSAD